MTYGTVKSNWQQAQNLINQQTQIIISELVESERKRALAEGARAAAEKVLSEYKDKPNSYTEGWYVKELGRAREARQKLESDLRRAQSFMRLKDQAKIKVERARDIAQRDVKNLRDINTLLRAKAGDTDALRTANEQQAVAWKEAVIKRREVESENKRLREQIARLEDVLRLGREGLKSETW